MSWIVTARFAVSVTSPVAVCPIGTEPNWRDAAPSGAPLVALIAPKQYTWPSLFAT